MLATAAMIQPLAWELPYTKGVALERKKEKKWKFKLLSLKSTYFYPYKLSIKELIFSGLSLLFQMKYFLPLTIIKIIPNINDR